MSLSPNMALSYSHDSADWLSTLDSIRGRIGPALSSSATLHDVTPLDLELRAMLHLPRFGREELDDQDLVNDEIERLATKIADLQREYKDWTRQEASDLLDKHTASVAEVPEAIAAIIHEKFHYIGAARKGRHFALYIPGIEVPAALATLSDMDVEKLRAYLPSGLLHSTLLLSRVFAFRWAPRNAITYLLGRAGRTIKKERQNVSFLTWVNPNMGFRATTYRAANWTCLGSEPTIYRYVGGDYFTARQLHQSPAGLQVCIETSKLSLAPLQVWHYLNVV